MVQVKGTRASGKGGVVGLRALDTNIFQLGAGSKIYNLCGDVDEEAKVH